MEIIESVLSQTICEGAGDIGGKIDEHFKGDIPHLFKVVFESIKVEYGSFLAGKFALGGEEKGADKNTPQV